MKSYRNFKIIFSTILITILLISVFSLSATALPTENYDFPDFTEEDALTFVENHNIDIPIKLSRSNDLGEFTLSLILQSYYNPDIEFCFNYGETQRYAENIRDTVALYVNLATVPSVASTETYQLQYNKVMDADGNWVTSGGYFDTKWLYYNCYAYAINRAEQPQFYSSAPLMQYQPGNMSGAGRFGDCATINELAVLVKADLEAMGYSNISLSETIPTINSSQRLICVRMSCGDYHFMYYDIETNAWYHKPGNTAVLRYNYVPSNSRIWYVESSTPNGESYTDDYYDSDIIFIKYSKNQLNIATDTTARKTIQAGKDVFYELNFTSAGSYKIDLTSTYAVDYEVYDEDFNVIRSGTSTSNSFSLNVENAGTTYYLRMNFDSYTGSHYVDISIHKHSYTYTWLSESQHRKTCTCSTTTAAHVISQSASSTSEYGICMLCGGIAFRGVYEKDSIDELPHTENGSYILPNGVIVLADEDIEAYMNGTLTFHVGETE